MESALEKHVSKIVPLSQVPLERLVEKEDKRAALLVLSVKVTVWPTEGYAQRKEFELCPPDVQRYCDLSFQ